MVADGQLTLLWSGPDKVQSNQALINIYLQMKIIHQKLVGDGSKAN